MVFPCKFDRFSFQKIFALRAKNDRGFLFFSDFDLGKNTRGFLFFSKISEINRPGFLFKGGVYFQSHGNRLPLSGRPPLFQNAGQFGVGVDQKSWDSGSKFPGFLINPPYFEAGLARREGVD